MCMWCACVYVPCKSGTQRLWYVPPRSSQFMRRPSYHHWLNSSVSLITPALQPAWEPEALPRLLLMPRTPLCWDPNPTRSSKWLVSVESRRSGMCGGSNLPRSRRFMLTDLKSGWLHTSSAPRCCAPIRTDTVTSNLEMQSLATRETSLLGYATCHRHRTAIRRTLLPRQR